MWDYYQILINLQINKFESSSDEEFQNNRRPFSTRIANKKVKFPSSVATTSKPMTSIQRNSKNIRVKPSRARPMQKCPVPVARRTVKSSHQQIKELNICNFAECEAELSGSDSFDDLEVSIIFLLISACGLWNSSIGIAHEYITDDDNYVYHNTCIYLIPNIWMKWININELICFWKEVLFWYK